MELTKQEEELVLNHLGLADRIAYSEWKKASHILDREELKSIAYEGLIQAAKRWKDYCASKPGYSDQDVQFFPKFAGLRIRGAIIDFLRHEDYASRGQRAKSKRLRAAGLDRGASIGEMAEASDMTEREVFKTIHHMARRPVSVEAEDIDYTTTKTIESDITVSYLLEVVVRVISEMDPLSQTILALHYYAHKQLQDIAKIIGMNEHRSSELHTAAVIKVRKVLEEAITTGDRNM